MTHDEAQEELFNMPANQPDLAVDFYRRVLRAGVSWHGLEKRLAHLQDDSDKMHKSLVQVWREEGSPD